MCRFDGLKAIGERWMASSGRWTNLKSRTLAIDMGIPNSSASSGQYAPMSDHSTCMLGDCRQAEVLAAGVLG
jgi:hypothetical protein